MTLKVVIHCSWEHAKPLVIWGDMFYMFYVKILLREDWTVRGCMGPVSHTSSTGLSTVEGHKIPLCLIFWNAIEIYTCDFVQTSPVVKFLAEQSLLLISVYTSINLAFSVGTWKGGNLSENVDSWSSYLRNTCLPWELYNFSNYKLNSVKEVCLRSLEFFSPHFCFFFLFFYLLLVFHSSHCIHINIIQFHLLYIWLSPVDFYISRYLSIGTPIQNAPKICFVELETYLGEKLILCWECVCYTFQTGAEPDPLWKRVHPFCCASPNFQFSG